MSKTRKILSVVVALMMVVASFAVTASAAYYYESEEDVANYTQVWALSEPVDNDDGTWTVDVSLTTNYPTGAIQFVVTNTNTAAADITDVALGAAIPADYNADITENNGKVIIVPSTTGVDTIEGVAINGVIATLTYTYSGTGSATIAIENAPKSEAAPAGSLIAARVTDADVVNGDMITGQTVTSTGESRVIGAAVVPPELVAIDGTIGVVDTSRTMLDEDNGIECDGYIYGVDPYDAGETVDTVFEVVGDGTMNIVANDAGSECGTGTMVEVLDLDGNVVATYVLIIFGDVDGDGEATGFDASAIELHDAYMLNDETGRFLTYQAFAGDVDGDSEATSFDAGAIELHEAYMLNDDTGRLVISDIIAML